MPGIEDILMAEGFKAVSPDMRGTWVPVTTFNPVTSPYYANSESRQVRVNDLVSKINGSKIATGKAIGQGSKKVSSDFYTPNNNQANAALGIFREFTERAKNPKSKHNGYVAFDIETMGDRSINGGSGFGVTEIAAQGFARQPDGSYKANSKSVFSALLALDDKSATSVKDMIKKIRTDPYNFRRMTSSEQRTVIDLMRYSTLNDGGVSGAMISTNRGITNITHNNVVNQVLRSDGTVDDLKFIQNFEYYMRHITQGFTDLQAKGDKNHLGVINRYNKFIHENRYKYFLSHNGVNFDIPALEQWSQKMGEPIMGPKKHIDFLKVIQATYPNMKGMHTDFGRTFAASSPSGGLATLQEIRKTMGFDQGAAHNAMHDIGEEGLGGAFSKMFGKIDSKITDAEVLPGVTQNGFNYKPSQLSWSERVLQRGDRLFSVGGSRAYNNTIDDFQAVMDEEGNFKAEDPDFNRQAVNSKSFYEVKGMRNISDYNDDGSLKMNRLALELYDEDSKKSSFVIREGDNAVDQIEEFVQRKFYNWDGLDKDTKREIRVNKERDLARRRYDNLFSLSGAGGNTTTKGFEAAKRMYGNAEIYRQRVEGKNSHIDSILDQLDMDSDVAKKTLLDKRITHEDMLSQMNFNSLKGGVENEAEKKLFFRMAPRMVDELPHYGSAIQKIEEAYPITGDMSAAEIKSVRQKRDIAWRIYGDEMTRQVGGDTETRARLPFEQRGIHYNDRTRKDKAQRFLNFETMETARNSIYNQLGKKEDGPVRKEKLTHMIMSMQESGVIDKKTANQFHGMNRTFALNDTINMMVQDLIDNHDIMQSEIEVRSVGRRKELTSFDAQRNEEIISSSIKKAGGVQGFIMQQGLSGGRVNMTEEASDIFKRLDSVQSSKLNPNNYAAVSHVLESFRSTAENDGFHGMQYALSVNQEGTQAKIQVFKGENSSSVMEDFLRGKSNDKAVEMTIPLIQQNGTHVIGNQVLNARSYLINEGGQTKTISSAEMIARGYTDSYQMREILKAVRDDDFDQANKVAKRSLRNEIESLSGIKRNLVSSNDSYHFANNDSDFLKQSHVSIAPAMIDDWHKAGRIDLDKDIRNRSKDVKEVLRTGNGSLRSATFDDLNPAKAYEMLKEVDTWAASKGIEVYAGGVKSENVSKGIWSFQNIQDYHPLGAYTFNGRDNAVQWFNSYSVNDKTKQRLIKSGLDPSYFEPMVATEASLERANKSPMQRGVNMKVAYMSQGQLDKRIEQLLNDSSVSERLKKELDDPITRARLYEQQAVFTKEFMDAFKVDNHSFIDKGDGFTWSSNMYDGEVLKSKVAPGEVLGTRMVGGMEEVVRYEGNQTGRILTGPNENRIGIGTSDTPFKFMIEGEKVTDTRVSREVMNLITGAEDIMAIYNPDVAKHNDFGAMMTGQAKLLADEVRKMQGEQKERAIRAIESSEVGMTYRDGQFVVNKEGDIKTTAFDELFAHPDINISNKTSTGLTMAVQEVRPSQVKNYSRMSDADGRVVIGFDGDGNAIHAGGENAIKGVTWGHREYAVLDNMGATATKDYMYARMQSIGDRAKESVNMAMSLKALADPESVGGGAVNVNDLKTLPTLGYNRETIKGTVFDRSYIESVMHGSGSEHGYWLQLPEVDGMKYTITDRVEGRGTNAKTIDKVVDKIFIPYTAQEGKSGDIYLRDLQTKIADIYKKANAIGGADGVKSRGEAIDAHADLQKSINRYVDQIAKDVTSSKGQTYSSVFKTDMNSSGSGIFKLIDIQSSEALKGEYTYISRSDANKMGILERLESGKETYTMNVRYPTFHDQAMQVTKLRVHDGVKSGEFHITALTSALMKADSDGDYDNIVAIDDDNLQDEWKRIYDERASERSTAIKKLESDYDEDLKRKFDLDNLTEGSEFSPYEANSREELKAKSGKMVIGHASNVNYAMRQMAKSHLSHNEAARGLINDFGQDLEQKLISSKHGAQEIDHAMDFINSIYSASSKEDWSKVHAYDHDFFKGDHKEAIEELRKIHSPSAIRSPRTKLGTSSGISISQVGVGGLTDLIFSDDYTANSGGNLWQRMLESEPDIPEVESGFRVEPNEPGFFKRGSRRSGGFSGLMSEGIEDLTGGMLGMRANDAIKGAMEKVFAGPKGGRNKMIAGGAGVALAGLIGYNTLSDDEPVMPYNFSNPDEDYEYTAPTPQTTPQPVQTQNTGSSITISAKGAGQNTASFAGMVGQGMQSSNYQGGQMNMSVNHSDNTNRINRNWYKDKVEQYA